MVQCSKVQKEAFAALFAASTWQTETYKTWTWAFVVNGMMNKSAKYLQRGKGDTRSSSKEQPAARNSSKSIKRGAETGIEDWSGRWRCDQLQRIGCHLRIHPTVPPRRSRDSQRLASTTATLVLFRLIPTASLFGSPPGATAFCTAAPIAISPHCQPSLPALTTSFFSASLVLLASTHASISAPQIQLFLLPVPALAPRQSRFLAPARLVPPDPLLLQRATQQLPDKDKKSIAKALQQLVAVVVAFGFLPYRIHW
ncbi:hypothetical protein CDD81_5314 [Ophiocordyceps australis]|uniref:Uncharacterized protein n=1 Tax=Ophiocordyceps australis TaxID=1399860 RepID=A0A2C5YI44_9HYPO|nr:hypothetical protein CDD81_5314 [Ophiocordyceps australis]